MWGERVEFGTLVGKTMRSVEVIDDNECVRFTTETGEIFDLSHDQDCCESVTLEDVCGELSDLVGAPIMVATEDTSEDEAPPEGYYADDCAVWTFYHIRTIKGTVTLRWFGTSNGYYSVDVDLHKVNTNPLD